MGTGRPHVEITAATLAGGSKNQDRYAYGDGWAFVLDGASSFTKAQPEHDGGWYAERLMRALSAGLDDTPERTTPEIVEDAIRVVAGAHGGTAESCPTSTIALARWGSGVIETYMLGDSTIALISSKTHGTLTDTRLAEIARPIRTEYRSRLRAGSGFDARHGELLRELQAQQAAARNQRSGYWIAGMEPTAAHHAVIDTHPIEELTQAVIASDGAAAALRYGAFPTWSALAEASPHEVLATIQAMERSDVGASRWPRSKPHDDKTVVILSFPTPAAL